MFRTAESKQQSSTLFVILFQSTRNLFPKDTRMYKGDLAQLSQILRIASIKKGIFTNSFCSNFCTLSFGSQHFKSGCAQHRKKPFCRSLFPLTRPSLMSALIWAHRTLSRQKETKTTCTNTHLGIKSQNFCFRNTSSNWLFHPQQQCLSSSMASLISCWQSDPGKKRRIGSCSHQAVLNYIVSTGFTLISLSNYVSVMKKLGSLKGGQVRLSALLISEFGSRSMAASTLLSSSGNSLSRIRHARLRFTFTASVSVTAERCWVDPESPLVSFKTALRCWNQLNFQILQARKRTWDLSHDDFACITKKVVIDRCESPSVFDWR